VKKPVKGKPVPKAKTHRKPVHVTPKIAAARHAAALRAAKTRAVNAKKAKTHAKARGYAVGELLPVCSFEAVAQALRLAGQRVTDDELAWLYELHGELSIPDAAAALGVTVRPAPSMAGTLLLGVDVPGPHAVLATPDGWWSWGELYAPWRCRIEEVWEVTW
jgi:hypothetical protein